MDPFILTLQFDAKTAALFQRARETHFPPELNKVPAHLTLFHQLPGNEDRAILKAIGRAAASRPPFPVEVSGLIKLGRGVAYRIESDALLALQGELAATFRPWLIGQDKQGFRPHVTVQNKTSPARAGALFDHLNETFRPFEATAEGLQLWIYKSGPWRPAAAIAFQG